MIHGSRLKSIISANNNCIILRHTRGTLFISNKTMTKINLMHLLILILIFAVSGCDKGCDVTVTSVAKIDNQTKRDLSVSVCLGQHSKKIISLSASQNGLINLETQKHTKIKTGGPPNACDPVQQKTGTFLMAEQFNEVKFCHNPEASSEVTVVELNQDCPAGLIAQSVPVENCQ